MDVRSKTFVIALICAGASLTTGSWAAAAPPRPGGIGGAVHGRLAGAPLGAGGVGGLHSTVGTGTIRSWPAGGAVAVNTFRGGWRERDWRDDWRRRHGFGFGLGFATGEVVGTALAAPWWYDDDDYDYASYAYVPAYYEYDDYAWDRPDIRYCEMRFKSYDPLTRAYLGYDGRRHPCP